MLKSTSTLGSRVLAIIAVTLLLCGWFSSAGIFTSFEDFAATGEDLRQDVLRLHILANSDSAEDQRIKLKVRDRILAMDSEIFANTAKKDKESMGAGLVEAFPKIRMEIEDELKAQGSNQSSSIELVNMYFTTREYEDFTFPAGNYDALRITLGEAKGKNWWCVLYPPLCLPAATAAEQEEAMALLTPEEKALIQKESEYKYGFAIIEWFEAIKAWL